MAVIKILIMGNGFDLAHGLPTKYMDFIDFAKAVERANIEELGNVNHVNKLIKCLNEWNRNRGILPYKWAVNNIEILDEVYSCIRDNIWYIYFNDLLKSTVMIGDNWLEFESELRKIIQFFDRNVRDKDIAYTAFDRGIIKPYLKGDMELNTLIPRLAAFRSVVEAQHIDMALSDFINRLYGDLNRIIRAFELYLSCLVEEIPVRCKSYIKDMKPDFVINFNYTHVYDENYNKDGNAKVFYIHGECNGSRKTENNNMVLGVNEYLDDRDRRQKTNFAMFKKFFQRISKRVQNGYVSQINKAISTNQDDIEIIIIGHSLDVTDKDILERYLFLDRANIVIYGKDESSIGKLIANTMEIIGPDKLNDKYYDIDNGISFLSVPAEK